MPTILVLGGTGMLGAPVVTRLLDDDFAIRLLARHPDRARRRFPRSVDVIAGDATDRRAVARAAAGCQGIHISVSGPSDRPAAEHVAAVAERAGVERITYLSGSTVSEENAWFPMIREKLAAERALREGPVPVTILCPTWPMEQLPRFVRDGRATLIGDQPTPLHWFAAADLARMVSAAFRTEAAAGTRLHVHGPEAIPIRAALERYCRAEHPGAEILSLPVPAARVAAEQAGDPVLGFMAELMDYFDRVGERGDAAEADRLLGPNTITLDSWLASRRRAVEA
jgi:uncharacterized protein YbjT (DUF2867 family)